MTTQPKNPITLVSPSSQILNEVAEPISPKIIRSPEIQALIDAMLSIAQGEQGDAKRKTMVGLAAPQVGISKRIIIVDTTSTGMGETPHLQVYINPVITKRSKQTEPGREGCYSTGNVCGIVERATEITIEAHDRNGQPVSETWSGFTARIFQHEVDHLDGIRFPDRIHDDTKLHWVEADQFDEYRIHWSIWGVTCPRERWDAIKAGTYGGG